MGGHLLLATWTAQALKDKSRLLAARYFSVEKNLTDMMIEKGSIAIDGISLTIVSVVDGTFSVALIPYTVSATTLGFKKAILGEH